MPMENMSEMQPPMVEMQPPEMMPPQGMPQWKPLNL
jgi:hypothetical protein